MCFPVRMAGLLLFASDLGLEEDSERSGGENDPYACLCVGGKLGLILLEWQCFMHRKESYEAGKRAEFLSPGRRGCGL